MGRRNVEKTEIGCMIVTSDRETKLLYVWGSQEIGDVSYFGTISLLTNLKQLTF